MIVNADFSRTLSLLRQEKGISQRKAAKELGISQALLSHYENGIREPGLNFVVKVCNYYNVSADFLLGRSMARDGTVIGTEELYDYSDEKDNRLRGSVLATLYKKLIVNSVGVLFDLLGKLGDRESIRAAGEYMEAGIYALTRHLYQVSPDGREDMFSVPVRRFEGGCVQAEAAACHSDFVCAVSDCRDTQRTFPPMENAAMEQTYPGMYQSLLQVVHTTEERINKHTAARKTP